MALIKCPECGKEISDKALFCPNCGYNNAENEENTSVYKLPITYQILGFVSVFAIIVGILIGIIQLVNKASSSAVITSFAIAASGIPLFVFFQIANDIHYIAFLAEKQKIYDVRQQNDTVQKQGDSQHK